MSIEHKNTVQNCRATTLVELVVAIAIMVVVMSTVFTVIAPARQTFDTQTNTLEVLQNGRILIDALIRELSKAKQITAVSEADDTTGYIEFTDNETNTLRFDINATSNHVQFGATGDLHDLAGPVSQLQFTCYDVCDLDTPITDANDIRFIEIETTLTNSAERGQDRVFKTSVYVWRDGDATIPGFEGWWCLDDETGATARDSSGHGRHGTLENMAGDEWTTGVLDGALEFNGSTDYVDLPIGALIAETTDCTFAAWVKWSGMGDQWQRIFDFGSGTTYNMYLVSNNYDDYVAYAITDSGWTSEDRIWTSVALTSDWHHLAVTIDDANTTHTLYLDGEVIGQNTSATTNPSDLGETTNNWLGKPQYSDEPYFDGILDDVRLYSRALSAQEISDLISDAPWVVYKDFEEAKTSAAQFLTIPTPGSSGSTGDDPVSGLGSATASPFTVPSGTNRLLVMTAHVEDNDDDIALEAVTYGGQAMTKITEELISESGYRAYVVAYMLNEAGIASASGNEFVKTWSSTPDEGSYYSFAVENVNQSSPIGDSDSGEHNKHKTIWADTALSTNDGDRVILAGTAGNTGEYTVQEGFTEAEELYIDSADGVIGHFAADGDDVWCGIYHNSPNRQVIIGFVIQKGSASVEPVTTIEGDLLIAAVATDSSETISEPSGEDWSLLSHGTGDGSVTLGVWAKLASASESPTHTFTWTSDEEAYGWIMRFEGFDPSSPLDVIESQGGGATMYPPSPSVTTSDINTMILRLGGFDKDKITVDDTGLSGYTTITMDENDGGKGSASGGAAYQYQLETGSSGSDTFELTDDEQYRTVTIAIAPAQ